MQTKILVIHGPNLNLLGKREPNIYGKFTLKEINNKLNKLADSLNVKIKIAQSNHEGEIVDLIGAAESKFDAIIMNPAAYTHTSVAIRDAISAIKIPVVEVHLSNIYAREDFRQKSLISAVCAGGLYGFGAETYLLGLRAAVCVCLSKAPKPR